LKEQHLTIRAKTRLNGFGRPGRCWPDRDSDLRVRLIQLLLVLLVTVRDRDSGYRRQ
jgi:hypothetical protein